MGQCPIKARTVAEQDAFMDGQLNALRLAERKGVEYARWIIEGSQKTLRKCREPSVGAEPEHTLRGPSV